MKMKRIILVVCLLMACGAGTSAAGQDTQGGEKRQSIRRLLRLMKAGEAGVQTIEQLLPQMRLLFGSLFDTLPAAKKNTAVRVMEEEVRQVFTAERMVEEIIPIYDKHLTEGEIKELIAFYETPVGQKFVAVQPQILKEAGEVGDRLAKGGAQRILQKLRAQGIVPDPRPASRVAEPPRPRRRP